jgi:transposase
MVRIIGDLVGDRRQLDERIKPVTDEIETLAKSDDSCRRVMTEPGIGPLISSAMVAAIGNGTAFANGREYSAWLGLVPKQISTRDRTILGRISKHGNGYLRMLFMQAARVILLRPKNWSKHGFGAWLVRAAQRLHPKVLAAALAKSWHGLPGPCWRKSETMGRASLRQQPNEHAQVHQGDGHRSLSPPSLARSGERATVASRGRL